MATVCDRYPQHRGRSVCTKGAITTRFDRFHIRGENIWGFSMPYFEIPSCLQFLIQCTDPLISQTENLRRNSSESQGNTSILDDLTPHDLMFCTSMHCRKCINYGHVWHVVHLTFMQESTIPSSFLSIIVIIFP